MRQLTPAGARYILQGSVCCFLLFDKGLAFFARPLMGRSSGKTSQHQNESKRHRFEEGDAEDYLLA